MKNENEPSEWPGVGMAVTGSDEVELGLCVEQHRVDRDGLHGEAGHQAHVGHAQQLGVGRADVDGHGELLGQGIDPSDVIEVAVRHQDGLRRGGDLVAGGGHDVGLVAGVDDQGLAAAREQEAVRAERTEGQHEDIEVIGHLAYSFTCAEWNDLRYQARPCVVERASAAGRGAPRR